MQRSPCRGCLAEAGRSECLFLSESLSQIASDAVKLVDVIIPFGGPSYAASYSHVGKAGPLLAFPIEASIVPNQGNRLIGKIRVLHGKNRPGFKGSGVIYEALSRLEKEFPYDFEIVAPERLPFNEYLQLLGTVNVVVDQLYGDGLGMNALLAMAAHCVVLSSFDRVKEGGLDLIAAPAIQLGTTADAIFAQLSELRQWSAEEFGAVGAASRCYVEEHCAPVTIAAEIAERWERASPQEVRVRQ